MSTGISLFYSLFSLVRVVDTWLVVQLLGKNEIVGSFSRRVRQPNSIRG